MAKRDFKSAHSPLERASRQNAIRTVSRQLLRSRNEVKRYTSSGTLEDIKKAESDLGYTRIYNPTLLSESIKRTGDNGAVDDNFDNYISISLDPEPNEGAAPNTPHQISRRELLLNTSQKLQTIFDEETAREKKN